MTAVPASEVARGALDDNDAGACLARGKCRAQSRIPTTQHGNIVHIAKTIHLSLDFTSFVGVAR